ncbi:MAG: hypothetical protein G01um101420_544 [Parcubacteria group bacterium Gr01-1014_20]|nr:MAG: hypothetical protein G01um101420_544 [Parcubacteria group bacterium Gr01-1014_20]
MRVELYVYTFQGRANQFQIVYENERPKLPDWAQLVFKIEACDPNPAEAQETAEVCAQKTANNLGVNIDVCRWREVRKSVIRLRKKSHS